MEKKVPKLRFREFDKEWTEKKLGEISLPIISGRNKIKTYKGPYPVYGSTGIIGYSNCFIYNEKSILVARVGANAGQINKAFGQYDVSDNTLMIRPTNSYNFDFAFYQLYCYNLNKLVFGSGQPLVTAGQLKLIPLLIPDIPEQAKIASFLTSVDRKIEMLEKQLELQERYKKGMMQKLFSQEIRFKDENGEEFPEWEKRQLGEVVDVKSGLSKNQNTKAIGYKVTRIETISDGEVNLNKVGYVDTSVDIEEYKLSVGDILFSNINSVSHIGKTAIIRKDYNLYHGMNLLCIKSKGYSDSLFIYFLLNTAFMRSYFMTICNKAVNQASINQSELLKTNIFIPTLPEQQKMTKFLAFLDLKIESTKKKIEAAKQWKKGLLQQMFV